MDETTLYNIMVIVHDNVRLLKSLDEFDSQNAKLVMTKVIAQLELIDGLYGPRENETPNKEGMFTWLKRKL